MATSGKGITKAEKDRLKAIISDTITLLCRNGLNAKFQKEFVVEGLIGITVDKDELMLVSIKDTIKNPNAPPDSDQEVSDGGTPVLASGKKRKRKQRKSTDDDGGSDPKTPRTDTETEHGSSLTPSSHIRRPLFHGDDSRGSFSGQSYDGLSLQEMKHENVDYDLAHIVKKEPGFAQMNSGVSIQHIPQGLPMDAAMPTMPMPAGPMPPVQMGDLNEQVELMPGSGVYIKRATYNQLQFIDKGSKLVRKLVREIFPDVHLLASSSCMGKGESSAGLDRHKVEVIKDYVRENMPSMEERKMVAEIKDVCKKARYLLAKKAQKDASLVDESSSSFKHD